VSRDWRYKIPLEDVNGKYDKKGECSSELTQIAPHNTLKVVAGNYENALYFNCFNPSREISNIINNYTIW
jgi:hypothetical protein